MCRRLFPIAYGRVALFIPIILNLCTSFAFAGEAVDESDRKNRIAVQKLSIYLSQVEEYARIRREWGGGILLGIGAASAIGGIATAAAGTSAEIPISLGATAVVLGGIGAFIRTSPTDQELLPPSFREMSEASPLKVAEKRLLGETYLSIFGHQAKRNRLLGSAANIALGAALIGWYVSYSMRAHYSEVWGLWAFLLKPKWKPHSKSIISFRREKVALRFRLSDLGYTRCPPGALRLCPSCFNYQVIILNKLSYTFSNGY